MSTLLPKIWGFWKITRQDEFERCIWEMDFVILKMNLGVGFERWICEMDLRDGFDHLRDGFGWSRWIMELVCLNWQTARSLSVQALSIFDAQYEADQIIFGFQSSNPSQEVQSSRWHNQTGCSPELDFRFFKNLPIVTAIEHGGRKWSRNRIWWHHVQFTPISYR